MSSAASPSLHRLQPRRALETTAYGYEVIARTATTDDCVRHVRWIDCWCPDAAQFVLLDASPDLSTGSCHALFEAIGAAHLGRRIRLVCSAATLADDGLVEQLVDRDIGVLLAVGDDALAVDACGLIDRGVLGLRLGSHAVGEATDAQARMRARSLVQQAHAFGLRVVASQLPGTADERDLFAVGID